jgi:hypothetical protein
MTDLALTTAVILFQCILHRPGGTDVEMADGVTLHFRPDGQGRHVCPVANPEHIGRLSAIPEAYRMLGMVSADALAAAGLGASAPAPAAPVPLAPPVANTPPALVVAPQLEPAGAPPVPQEPPVIPPEANTLAPVLEPKPDAVAGDAVVPVDLSDEQWIEKYTALFGQPPHPNAKLSTIIRKIQEREASGAAA